MASDAPQSSGFPSAVARIRPLWRTPRIVRVTSLRKILPSAPRGPCCRALTQRQHSQRRHVPGFLAGIRHRPARSPHLYRQPRQLHGSQAAAQRPHPRPARFRRPRDAAVSRRPAPPDSAARRSEVSALRGRRGRRRRRRHPRHRPPQQDEPGGRDQRCALPEERRGARRPRPGASRPRGSFSPCGGLSTSLGPGPGHDAGRHHVLLLRCSTRFLHREPPTRAENTRSAVTTSACSRSASARYRQS